MHAFPIQYTNFVLFNLNIIVCSINLDAGLSFYCITFFLLVLLLLEKKTTSRVLYNVYTINHLYLNILPSII